MGVTTIEKAARQSGRAWAIGGAGAIAVVFVVLLQTAQAWDAPTYLAAGERLNAGHPLYELSAGDRVIPDAERVGGPLLSPPLIAVLWRPLALLGDAAIPVWWAACIAAILAACFIVARQAPVLLAVLSVPIAFELGAANVNAFILLAVCGVWLLRDRPMWAGVIIGFLAVLKLWPAVLLLWFVRERRWGAMWGFGAGALAATGIALLGAGFDNHLTYLSLGAKVEPSPLSLARFVPWPVLLFIGSALTLILPQRWSWVAAVSTMVLASPALYPNHLALLLATVLAWLGSLRHVHLLDISVGQRSRGLDAVDDQRLAGNQ